MMRPWRAVKDRQSSQISSRGTGPRSIQGFGIQMILQSQNRQRDSYIWHNPVAQMFFPSDGISVKR
jgi:hypothetical protein